MGWVEGRYVVRVFAYDDDEDDDDDDEDMLFVWVKR
jgi:hypothetical protein